MLKILIAKYKWYLIGAAITAFLVGMVFYTYKVYDYGRSVEKIRQAEALVQLRQDLDAAKQRAEQKNEKIKIVTKNVIKTVRVASENDNCARTDVSDPILSQLPSGPSR